MRTFHVDGRIVTDTRYSSAVKYLAQRGYYRLASLARWLGL